jgi:ABC-2 type transport system permease protein
MSAATAILERPLTGGDAGKRPSLARLAAVELRKMTDTRAGFWELVGFVATTIAAVVIRAVLGGDEDHTMRSILDIGLQPVNILLPLLGILLVSSEWSQRTSLITFALVPQRSRVLAAKLVAGVFLALAALVMTLGISAFATAVAAPGVEGTWSLPAPLLGQAVVYVVTAMFMGLGFGAMLLASAPAIVLYFAAPLAWAGLSAIPGLEGPARWLNAAQSLAPMSSRVMDATEWARAGTTLALWMLLPLLIGWWRIARNEVR